MLKTLVRAVQRSNDVVLITEAEPWDNPGPRIVYVNPAFERMTGYTAAEVLGKTPRFLQGPKTDAATTQRIRDALRQWLPVREELVNYRKDGSEFTVEVSIAPIADENGWFTHWVSIQRDVTEQCAMRDRIRESDERLKRILAAIPQLIWTADARCEVDWVSDSFLAFLGVEPAQCLGNHWLGFVHPDDQEVALARRDKGNPHSPSSRGEFRMRRFDGQYIWFNNRATCHLHADGTVERWTGSLTDISERKEAELVLLASEERLRLGIGVAKLGLMDLDYQAEVVQLSAEAARMYGLGDAEMTLPRRVVQRAIHPDDLAALLLRMAALRTSGSDWLETQYRIVLPHGETRWIRAWNTVLYDGKETGARPMRAIIASLDITEAKRAEHAKLEVARRFRELAGGIAHDFNNLLTSVMLHASMAGEQATDARLQRNLEAILQASQTAASITRGLTTLSEELAPPTQIVDIGQRVRRMVEVSELALGSEIEVVLQLAEKAVLVQMNAAQFDQIVLNLLTNAREAMPSGGRLTVGTGVVERRPSDGAAPRDAIAGDGTSGMSRFARLFVADTGVGIPPQAIPHLFEPYFSTKLNSAKQISGSRGLGLAILHTIVTNHHGEISVRSTPEAGTCFDVLLPVLATPPHDADAAPTAAAQPVAADLKTILLAEDDDGIRVLLQEALTNRGFYVLAAGDGQYATELAGGLQEKVDLLISDFRMPRMDGVLLARTLLETQPELKVLLISGHLGGSFADHQVLEQDWVLLRKPFPLEDLLQKVTAMMSEVAPSLSLG